MTRPRVPAHEATIEHLVQGAIRRSVDSLHRYERAVVAGDDPEAIHQFRVATRRLRSDLQTFSPLLDDGKAQALRDDLRWLGAVVGKVRDTEVLAARLRASAARLPQTSAAAHDGHDGHDGSPSFGEVLDAIGAQWQVDRNSLADAVASDRYRRAMAALDAAAAAPPFGPGTKKARRRIAATSPAVRRLVRRRWKALAAAVQALPAEPLDADLHRVRILAKRSRYAAEAVGPVFGADAEQFARRLEKVQTALGDHQDAVVAEQWLRALRARATPEAASLVEVVTGLADGAAGSVDPVDERADGIIGGLIENERLVQAHARVAWRKAWEKASAPKLRRWL